MTEAEGAAARDEVPVGAVIVDADRVIACAGNRMRELGDATAHAEILAIRAACRVLANERLSGCDIYVTLEPCPMCAAAISLVRLRRLVFAAPDPKSGGVLHGARIFDQPQCHHRPEIVDGINASAAATLMQVFFARRRKR